MLRSINGTSCKKKNFSRISSFSMRPFQDFLLRIWVHRLVFHLHFSKLLVVIVRPDKFVCWSHCSFLEQKRLVPLISGMLVEFRQGSCTNLLLTEREGRTGEYWPKVVAVRTERSEVRTKMTEGQYSPVRSRASEVSK